MATKTIGVVFTSSILLLQPHSCILFKLFGILVFVWMSGFFPPSFRSSRPLRFMHLNRSYKSIVLVKMRHRSFCTDCLDMVVVKVDPSVLNIKKNTLSNRLILHSFKRGPTIDELVRFLVCLRMLLTGAISICAIRVLDLFHFLILRFSCTLIDTLFPLTNRHLHLQSR